MHVATLWFHSLECSLCIDVGYLYCKAEQRKSSELLPSFGRHHWNSSSIWCNDLQLQSAALPPRSHHPNEPKAKNLTDDFYHTDYHPCISLPDVIYCRFLAFLWWATGSLHTKFLHPLHKQWSNHQSDTGSVWILYCSLPSIRLDSHHSSGVHHPQRKPQSTHTIAV